MCTPVPNIVNMTFMTLDQVRFKMSYGVKQNYIFFPLCTISMGRT